MINIRNQTIDIHSQTGLPIRLEIFSYEPLPVLPFSVFYDKEYIINFINSTLDNVESITVRKYFDKEYIWRIEYGTKPLEEIVKTQKEKQTLERGRLVAVYAAEKSRKKNNNINDDIEKDLIKFEETPVEETKIQMFKKKWSSIKIELTFNVFSNMYVIYLIKNRGDKTSFYHIGYKLQQGLKKIRDNTLWILRKKYIQLLEGLPLQTCRDNILTYLLNELIVKAVCEFMG